MRQQQATHPAKWICLNVKLQHKTVNTQQPKLIPDTVHSRMHGKEVANDGTLASDCAQQALRETGQVKAVYHVKARNGTLYDATNKQL
jgi:hypothetical protein